jgi:hypothetical protein
MVAAQPAQYVQPGDMVPASPPMMAPGGDCGCPDDCPPGGYGWRVMPPCSPLGCRLWARAEYLGWWMQGSSLPPLITTSPLGTTPEASGVLGQDTTILFGDATANDRARSGGRVTVGYWIGGCQGAAIEGSYLGIGQQKTEFSASSPQTQIIARPFVDLLNGIESAMLVAHPDFLAGAIQATAADEFQTAEVLFRRALFLRCDERLDLLVGYRYARLDDTLGVRQSSRWLSAQGTIVAGTTKELFDEFDARTQFNGAELGASYRDRLGRWSVEFLAKVAVGNSHSRVRIDGGTITTVPGAGSSTFLGGLLAQETNIGTHERDDLAVLPELGFTLGCDLTPRLRATFGYTLLYWSRVARAADQIELSASQLPPEAPAGAGDPRMPFLTSGFWAQGMNLGLEYQF